MKTLSNVCTRASKCSVIRHFISSRSFIYHSIPLQIFAEKQMEEKKESVTLLDLFRTPVLRMRFIVLCIMWWVSEWVIQSFSHPNLTVKLLLHSVFKPWLRRWLNEETMDVVIPWTGIQVRLIQSSPSGGRMLSRPVIETYCCIFIKRFILGHHGAKRVMGASRATNNYPTHLWRLQHSISVFAPLIPNIN